MSLECVLGDQVMVEAVEQGDQSFHRDAFDDRFINDTDVS